MDQPIVVVGAGAAGAIFASQYKKMVNNAQIILLDKGEYMGWSGCPMPYFIAQEITDKDVVGSGVDHFTNKLGIQAYLNTQVIEVLPSEKAVVIKRVEEETAQTLNYSKLVLATGAKPRSFTAEGFEDVKIGYFHLVHPKDSKEIYGYIDQYHPKKAVLMGSGAIGIEMAEAFLQRGMEVTIFSRSPVLFSNLYERELLEPLYQRLRDKGVKLCANATLQTVHTDKEGKVTGVTLTDGLYLEADLLFVAIGVEPNLAITGLQDLKRVKGRLWVDEYMKTSDSNIFALGDLVNTTHLITGKDIYLPLGDVADKQALVLAGYLSGKKSQGYRGGVASVTTSFFDIKLARTGLTLEQAQAMGYDVRSVEARAVTRVSAFADSSVSGGTMRLLYDDKTHKILGASMVGYNAVAQFIDQVAIALNFNATLEDMFEVDYAYSPTNSSVWNPFLVAYRKTLK